MRLTPLLTRQALCLALTVHLHAGSVSSSDCSNGHATNGSVHEAQQLRLGDPEAFTFGPVEAGPGADTPTSRRHALTGVGYLTLWRLPLATAAVICVS
jgi:hypothetical protein